MRLLSLVQIYLKILDFSLKSRLVSKLKFRNSLRKAFVLIIL